jgi:hypothetical protein
MAQKRKQPCNTNPKRLGGSAKRVKADPSATAVTELFPPNPLCEVLVNSDHMDMADGSIDNGITIESATSSATSKPSNEETSHNGLFSLPLEVRQKIYNLIVV